jgi:putative ABC transport system permease protein
MRYTDVILSAFSSLRQHKLRAALTMLGVVIGVASVIAMVSIGAGARERVATQIRSLGSNLLVVIPGNITQGGVRLGFGATPTPSSEDANAIASEISSVQIAAPLSTAKGQAVAGGINWATNISMVEPSYLEARDWEIAEGRSFEGEQRGAQVALLGRTVLDKLFPDTDAVGTTMRIGKVPFKIIGILAAKGQSAFGQDQDDVIYIPLVTGQRLGAIK